MNRIISYIFTYKKDCKFVGIADSANAVTLEACRRALGRPRRADILSCQPGCRGWGNELDEPSILVPCSVDNLILLEHRALTKNALLRAGRRVRKQSRAIRMARADAGKDFNAKWIDEMAR